MIHLTNEEVKNELLKGFGPFLDKGADQSKIRLVCECQADSLRQKGAVNVVSIARAVGLKVFEASLPNGVSGMLDCKEFSIFIKKNDSGRRQRFTCAHEIGHFLLHSHHEVVLLRSSRTGALEEDANSIAAEILMPECFVVDFIKKEGKNPVDMADKFKVSAEAANYRIKNISHRNNL